ncbi:MAG: hypothetical protein GEU73_10735 [Chloroflexi bacterium]|nr:hypothetical protein [Chloroflexota bacterium]
MPGASADCLGFPTAAGITSRASDVARRTALEYPRGQAHSLKIERELDEMEAEEAMAATSEPRNAAELGLTIEGVNHFTLPVRDHDKSRAFYVMLLGAEVRREPNWESVRAGRSNSTALAVRLCEGVEMDLFHQPFGMGEPDQFHPNHAFFVQSPDELRAFRSMLESNGTPTVLVTQQTDRELQAGTSCQAELHFRDPDGNHLEITCRSFPFGDDVRIGPPDLWDTVYDWRSWPKAE